MHRLYFWGERYLFRPTRPQKLLSYTLLPLTLLYCAIMKLRRRLAAPREFGLPIIGIGNLIVGGSGKTPMAIAIAERIHLPKAIVLRGYKRASRGMVVVSDGTRILCDLSRSGDEAMLLARRTDAIVIVSEDRTEGIEEAKRRGAQVVLLDDAFGKTAIKKFDILLRPRHDPSNPFCLPSGPYRESPALYAHADLCLREGRDFTREVTLPKGCEKMLLVTAISRPERLDPYLPPDIPKALFPDHATFDEAHLRTLMSRLDARCILTTAKDAVKMERFSLPIAILELRIELSQEAWRKIEAFIASYGTMSS